MGETSRGHQTYDWERIFGTVRTLQPDAVIFSDAGPDVRWVGNEAGVAGHTCWSSVDPSRVPAPGHSDPWTLDSLRHGEVGGQVLLAEASLDTDDGGALVLTPPGPVIANLLSLAEGIEHGQHVTAWRVEVDDGCRAWRPLTAGTTIGHRRIVRLPPTEVHRLRLLVDLAYGPARATDISLHHDAVGEHRRRPDAHD